MQKNTKIENEIEKTKKKLQELIREEYITKTLFVKKVKGIYDLPMLGFSMSLYEVIECALFFIKIKEIKEMKFEWNGRVVVVGSGMETNEIKKKYMRGECPVIQGKKSQ